MLIEHESELFVFCRNGTELPYITQDRSYDFNFQEIRHLPQERIVREGDTMQVVCNYLSKGRTKITLVSFAVLVTYQNDQWWISEFREPKQNLSEALVIGSFRCILQYTLGTFAREIPA